MIIFGLAVLIGSILAKIYRVEVVSVAVNLSITMKQIDDADAVHQAAFRAAVLALDQLDLLAVALVLNAVIYDKVAACAVLEQRGYDFPEAAGSDLLAPQEVADGIMALGLVACEMLRQVRAGIVARRGNQVFDVLLLGHNPTYVKLKAKVLKPICMDKLLCMIRIQRRYSPHTCTQLFLGLGCLSVLNTCG